MTSKERAVKVIAEAIDRHIRACPNGLLLANEAYDALRKAGLASAQRGAWVMLCKLLGHKWHCLGRFNKWEPYRTLRPQSSFSCWKCFRCGAEKTEQWDW